MRNRGAVVVLCVGAVAAHAEPDADRLLFDLYYAFEVTGYCSLVDEAVGRGFAARERMLRRRSGLDDAAVTQLRGKAWQAAHAEWQNRGLGGFRAWCRDDGQHYARQLAAHAPSRPADTRR